MAIFKSKLFRYGAFQIALFLSLLSCSDDERVSTTPDGVDVPAVPSGLAVEAYDTLAGVATLRWNSVKHPDLTGYAVYRNVPGHLDAMPVSQLLIKDTVFADSIFKDSLGAASRKYEYRVLAVGKNLDIRSKLSDAVTLDAVSPATITTTFSLNEPGLVGNRVILDETVGIVLSFANPTQGHRSLAWYREGKPDPIRRLENPGREGRDTLAMKFDSAGAERIRIELEDGRGRVYSMTREYQVQGPPLVTGFRLVKYDAVKGEVQLAWNRILRPGIGYTLFRSHDGAGLREMSGMPLKVTVFIDKVYSQDAGSSFALEYRAKMVDDHGQASPEFSRPVFVEAVPPALAKTAISISNIDKTGYLAAIGDTLHLAAAFSNPTRSIDSLSWYLDGGESPVRAIRASGKSGADTLSWVFDKPGKHFLRFLAVDSLGDRTDAGFDIQSSAILRVEPDSLERNWFASGIRMIAHPMSFRKPYPFQVSVVLSRGGSQHRVSARKVNDSLLTFTLDFQKPIEAGKWDMRIEITEIPRGVVEATLKSPGGFKVLEEKSPSIESLAPDSRGRGKTIRMAISGHKTRFLPGTAATLDMYFYKAPDTIARIVATSTGTRSEAGIWPWVEFPWMDISIPEDAPLGSYDLEVKTGEVNSAGDGLIYKTWPRKAAGFHVTE